MSRISLDNYEAFLLDYFEGNLSEDTIHELKTFILLHPELNIDLTNLDLPVLEKEENEIESKTDLLKTVNQYQEEKVLTYLEGLMSKQEKLQFENELNNNPELQALLNLYSNTILKQDFSEVFEGKETLLEKSDRVLLANPALNFVEENILNSNILIPTSFNSEVQSEIKSYAKTKLHADHSIVFPFKKEIKKETQLIVLYSRKKIIAVAAAVIFLIGFVWLFNFYFTTPAVQHTELSSLNKSKVNDQVNEIEKHKVIESYTESGHEINNSKNSQKKLQASHILQNKQIKSEHKKKDLFIQKDSLNNKNEVIENKLIADINYTKENKNIIPDAEDTLKVKETLVNQIEPDKKVKTTLLAYETDDEEIEAIAPEKKGFWKSAARLASNVNKLGMKAVNGKESEGDGFLLSFNSLSIEKK
ncbi:MAG: hypothetical protein IPM51_08810 [Sphingobacteriaceae bacterium]|nr:hypothetical protein [Sphingobacteriaceae bacterium]